MIKAFASVPQSTDDVCIKQDEDDFALDMLVCGEVLLVKDEWRICFSCSFCGKVVEGLSELLKHALGSHLSDVTQEQLAKLLNGLKPQNECPSPCEEQYASDDDTVMQKSNIEKVDIDEQDELEKKLEQEFAETFERFLADSVEDSYDKASADEWDWDASSTQSNETTDKTANFEVVLLDSSSQQGKSKNTDGKSKASSSELLCPFCKKSFSQRYRLESHLRSHSEIRPYPCNYCDAHFKDQTNLKVHHNRHLGIKPHECEICDKAFTSTTELKLHTRTHTGEKPYKCTQCERSFRSAAHLSAHVRRHTNYRPCLCTTCGKRFYDTKLLSDHMVSHSTVRPFVCSHCHVSFAGRKGLNQHMKLHSKIKGYACKYCPKRFAQCAGLHSHMKTHKPKK